jgi:hypothetical protein
LRLRERRWKTRVFGSGIAVSNGEARVELEVQVSALGLQRDAEVLQIFSEGISQFRHHWFVD